MNRLIHTFALIVLLSNTILSQCDELQNRRHQFSGRSVKGNGVDAYVSLGTTSNLISASSGSISLWVKLNGIKNSQAFIFTDVGGYIQLEQYINTAQCRFAIFSSGAKYAGTITLDTVNWYHLVCTWSNGTPPKLYKNAVVNAGSTNAGDIGNLTYDFRLCGQTISSTFTSCKIYRMEFWSTALTQTEITDLYNSGIPMDPEGLTNLSHSYNPGNGIDGYPTIYDRTGSRNGTMTNMSWKNFYYDLPQ